jgi:hypothetical protein
MRLAARPGSPSGAPETIAQTVSPKLNESFGTVQPGYSKVAIDSEAWGSNSERGLASEKFLSKSFSEIRARSRGTLRSERAAWVGVEPMPTPSLWRKEDAEDDENKGIPMSATKATKVAMRRPDLRFVR